MADSLRRRTFLRLGGVAALSSLAGCSTIQAELGLRTQQLGRVILANSSDEPVDVKVEVIQEGTTVLASTYQLTPGSSEERPQIVLNEWHDNPNAQRWEVRAKTPASEWRNAELTAAAGDRADCHRVHIVTGNWSESPMLVLPTDCKQTLNEEISPR
ncbi:hypothetical protein [Natrinema sp. 1APR25-10V2]|uniref:hypothetical protein n=1 Tax=Natrinema sp. 1APR25-10V2 TaxID=2951081 RepID=UPI0028748BAC|nr:hypothetical protein [Natrinema sp. 1APR25-10V2]MDS0476885.1 hypothetical protein [Natrinema sp. 1APR25-10V2]